MQTPLVFVGIDVSKARLDVVRPSDERTSVPYDAHGITTLLAQLTQVQPTRIVMEATGGLERLLLRALVDAALPVIVVNPRQVPAGDGAIDKNGTLLGTIETGQPTSNVAWGEDGQTLFITSGSSVYRLCLTTSGARY